MKARTAGLRLKLNDISNSGGPMPYSASSLAILRTMRDKNSYLLRGDRSHGCQVRYNAVTKKREDRTALSLIPLERAGLIEFATEPLDPIRYYSVRMTQKGQDFLEENDTPVLHRSNQRR